jgi:drug/metabolite transporter (DMT)-like permease
MLSVIMTSTVTAEASDTDSRKTGIFQVGLSGALFGLLGIFGKTLFEKGVTPGELLSLRFSIAALILWPIIMTRFPFQWKLSRSQIAACAFLGMGGYAIFSFCFFVALKGLSASLAVLLLYTYPVIVTLAAWVFWGDAVPKSKWPAVPLTMFGIVLLVWGEFNVTQMFGLFAGIASAVLYSVYILASSRLLKSTHPLIALTYILTFAGLMLSAIHLRDPVRVGSIIAENWPVILGIATLSTVGAMSLFLAGLQKLRPWEVSLLSTLEPVTGVALATLLLSERLSASQALGATGVLAGLVFVSLPTSSSKRSIAEN